MHLTIMGDSKGNRGRSNSLPGWKESQFYPNCPASLGLDGGVKKSTPPAKRKFAVNSKNCHNNNQRNLYIPEERRGSHIVVRADGEAASMPRSELIHESVIMGKEGNKAEFPFCNGKTGKRLSRRNSGGLGGRGCVCCGIQGNSNCCWWEPDIYDTSDSVDFALETSLHGLKYICQPRRHLIERIFWSIAFIIGMVMAGWLISDVWLTYISSPLIVTFEPFETTIDKIPFPAITICNMNKVLKSKAEEYLRNAQGPDEDERTIEARKNVYYLDHVCSSSKSFSQKFNFSARRGNVDPEILKGIRLGDDDDEQRDVARFLQIASQPCTEMLLLCAWQDDIYNCSDLFKPIETDFGKCCTFNMIPHMLLYKNLNEKRYNEEELAEWAKWDLEKNGLLVNDVKRNSEFLSGHAPENKFPRRQNRAGKSSGLSVLLNPDLHEYFCTSSDSHGFQLVKHLPIDVPKAVDFGIAVRPNSEVFMGIRPEITLADTDIKNFSLEKRNCYFHGEYNLAYYSIYTSHNCYDECLANQTYEICGCVSYYMPRDDTRELCGASKFACAEDLRNEGLQTGIKSKCDICLPVCNELEYFSETTFTPIQKGDIWIDDFNVTSKWSTKNLSIVHIYFSSDSTYARVRKELYGITDLIANTGGLMGFCLGFSGLSLIELIYFFTLRAWCRTRRRQSMWSLAALKFQRFLVDKKINKGNGSNGYCHGIPKLVVSDEESVCEKPRRFISFDEESVCQDPYASYLTKTH